MFKDVILAVVAIPLVLSGCASGPKAVELKFGKAPVQPVVQEAWSFQTPGIITDLALSSSGDSLLVSTIPNRESGTGHHMTVCVDTASGRIRWRAPLDSQVRAQGVANGCRSAVITTHNGEMNAFGPAGAPLWTVEAGCRPYIMNDKIICYHDDDPGPGTAFEVFDQSGRKTMTFPSPNDILAMKLAAEGRGLVIALTRGQVLLLDAKIRSLWQRKMKGEILDAAVSREDRPRVAVLYGAARKKQKISFINAAGVPEAVTSLPFHAEYLELTPDGTNIVAFGNSPQGQSLGFYAFGGGKLSEVWRRTEPKFADFSPPPSVAGQYLIAGFELIQDIERRSVLVGFDRAGGLAWSLPVETEEGAYLYTASDGTAGVRVHVTSGDTKIKSYLVK